MRIIGGRHGGRKLHVPSGRDIRPTSDKVRQAVFNALQSRGAIEEAVVLDAFCGTGALGLEALSQGASFCIFIDKAKSSLTLCRSNIASLEEEKRTQTFLLDSSKLKNKPDDVPPASLIFLDPPYNKELVSATLIALEKGAWLADEVFFVIETARTEEPDLSALQVLSEKIYGDTKVILARK
jgi:16S rRNA (guanine966-N2)-methyltransferase